MNNFQKTRFIVTLDNKPRCVLSVSEKPSGDLLLVLYGSGKIRTPGLFINSLSDDPEHGRVISEYRCSVHVSPNSKNSLNTIKVTRRDIEGNESTIVQNTVAIKQTNTFAPIYARRNTSLQDDNYDLKDYKKCKVLNIGDFTKDFTHIFAVFVGPPNRVFICPQPKDFKIKQVNYKEFSLVILWSFLSIPCHESGHFIHAATTPGIMASEGYNEHVCVEIFDQFRFKLRKEFIETLSKADEINDILPVIQQSTYFRKGNMKSRQFREHLRQMITDGIFKL